jgi:hypothetical protein
MTGSIAIDGTTATLHFQRRLAQPIEAVWAALTKPPNAPPGLARRRSSRAPAAASTRTPTIPRCRHS